MSKPEEKVVSGKPLVHLWCDGSCPIPGSAGGWAYILIIMATGTEKIGSSGMEKCTNNIAELRGAIDGIKILPVPCKIEIFSDSQYLCNGLNSWRHNWKKKGWKHSDVGTKQMIDIKNKELWVELDKLCYTHEIKANWVKGHCGIELNERCDVLSRKTMEKFK